MERAVLWHEMVLYALAGAFVVYGLFALAQPARAASMVDLQLEGPGAFSEIRAIYGGMMVAFGAVVVIGLLRQSSPFLLTVAILFFGLVVGRVASLVTDGFSKTAIALGLVEVSSAGLMLYAAGYLNRG